MNDQELQETQLPIPVRYKLAVVGSRTFTNKEAVFEVLDAALNSISLIISGGATGADTLAEQWADVNKKSKYIIRPDWYPDGKPGRFVKGAGFIRNREIVKACDRLIAFWDGSSKGTIHSIEQCISLQKPYFVVTEESQLTAP